MIRKMLVIGLCSILALEAFLPDVNLADVSHLPDLLSHFQRHREETPDITFGEFLLLHYDNPVHLAASPADHQDLPFSKRLHYRLPLQIAQEPEQIATQTPFIVLDKSEGKTDCTLHTNNVASQVWQPPRA